MADDPASPVPNSPEMAELVELRRDIRAAEQDLATLKAQAEQCTAWLAAVQLQLDAVPSPDSLVARQILSVQEAVADYQRDASAKSDQIASSRQQLKKGLPKGAGSCAKELEERLQSPDTQCAQTSILQRHVCWQPHRQALQSKLHYLF